MKHTLHLFAMLGVILLLAGCGNPKLEGSIYIPPGGWELQFPDSPAGPTTVPCTGERPPNQGCTRACKPCFVFYCKDGEWTRVRIPYPPGMCDGSRPSAGSPINVCPRTAEGGCPAECVYCF